MANRTLIGRLYDQENDLCTEAANKIGELKAKLARVEGLLKVADCPDPNCDQNGTVCLGVYQHDGGQVEYDLHQCQWCDERKQALEQDD